VALGFKGHIGWAAVVAVASPAGRLEIVAKRRLDLATTFDAGAVYHVGAKLPLAQASAMIAAATEEFARAAAKLVAELIAELAAAGRRVEVAAIIGEAAKRQPAIESILKSHALIHAAEGELYRSVFAGASAACGLHTLRIAPKELASSARAALGVSEVALGEQLAALGKSSGRPWAADQKESALAAIVALASRGAT
jgi:hypothetical protein